MMLACRYDGWHGIPRGRRGQFRRGGAPNCCAGTIAASRYSQSSIVKIVRKTNSLWYRPLTIKTPASLNAVDGLISATRLEHEGSAARQVSRLLPATPGTRRAWHLAFDWLRTHQAEPARRFHEAIHGSLSAFDSLPSGQYSSICLFGQRISVFDGDKTNSSFLSSRGGVEGHANLWVGSGARRELSPRVGIKPGPREALPFWRRAVGSLIRSGETRLAVTLASSVANSFTRATPSRRTLGGLADTLTSPPFSSCSGIAGKNFVQKKEQVSMRALPQLACIRSSNSFGEAA